MEGLLLIIFLAMMLFESSYSGIWNCFLSGGNYKAGADTVCLRLFIDTSFYIIF